MNDYWIAGLFSAMFFFAIVEGMAFKHPERINSLSRAIYDLGSNFPLSIWVCGVFTGGLAVHFFWHWCPPGSVSMGLLRLFDIG